MSLITRCPACRTMFKVVPDQLRVSEGWVRCGKCDEIFNASEQMQEALSPQPEQTQSNGPDTETLEAALAEAALADKTPTPTRSKSNGQRSRKSGSGARASKSVDFELKADAQETEPLLEPALPSSGFLSAESAHGFLASAGAQEDVAPTAPQLSFMRGAGANSFWQRPVIRTMLLLLSVVLMGTLALQFVVQERDRIVAMEPALQGLVQEVCEWMDCEVHPLRQIESVVIDSSAFSKSKGDLYRLSVTLKNTAPIDLAVPAIELSLTDTLDQPLIRRVFRPQDMGARSGVIAARGEFRTSLELVIKNTGGGERLAGYRLLAFYP